MVQPEDGPGFLKRIALRLADADQHIRGERWRPLVRRLYWLLAPFYDRGAAWMMPDYREAIGRMLDAVVTSPQARLLDLGCGTGMVTVPAASRVELTVGIDMTRAMLQQAREKQRDGHPHLVRGDVRFLPFPDRGFDIVTTSFMLLHLTENEKQSVLTETYRVLETGGRFGALTGRESTTGAYPTPGEWRDWLQKAGFVDVLVASWGDAYYVVQAIAGSPG